jgi:hypothetical protein
LCLEPASSSGPSGYSGRASFRYRDFAASAPDELTVYAAALTTPDRFDALAIALCYCGDDLEPQAKNFSGCYESLEKPVADMVGPMPYVVVQQMLDAAFPCGVRSYWKSNFISTLTDDAIDVFVSYARSRTSARTVCVIEPCHGQAQCVAPEAAAFGLRQHMFNLHILTLWEEGDPEPHIQWTRRFWTAIRPYSADAVYVNALGTDDVGRIREAYGANYPSKQIAAPMRNIQPPSLGGTLLACHPSATETPPRRQLHVNPD